MQSQPSQPDFWLEPLDEKNLQDFYELSSDEKAAFWSTHRHAATPEASADLLTKALTMDVGKPWHVSCAVMTLSHPPPGGAHDAAPAATAKMIGVVKTTRASLWGLSIGYKLRSDCWGRGYATRAVAAFLNVYWSRPRRAPREEVFFRQTPGVGEAGSGVPRDGAPTGDEEVAARAAAGPGGDADEVEITHLIAQVDPENSGSMRVAEKCDGKLVAVDRGGIKVWRFPEMRDMAVWRLDKPSVNAGSV